MGVFLISSEKANTISIHTTHKGALAKFSIAKKQKVADMI